MPKTQNDPNKTEPPFLTIVSRVKPEDAEKAAR